MGWRIENESGGEMAVTPLRQTDESASVASELDRCAGDRGAEGVELHGKRALAHASIEARYDVPKKLPLHPGHPERICWGCDKYCPADDLACGNGTDRAQHPVEIFGDDWLDMGLDSSDAAVATPDSEPKR
ncbi:MAG TPA: DUF3079 domain-containing protein [Steroidobacteraceae bacterium]|nr:DUF3079 domain-containing protein [Steroidobacteraceae bacterium]